jgi:hypothetical protein
MRLPLVTAMLAAMALHAAAGEPAPAAPVTYEIQVNGESFLVEGDRVVTLTSQQHPGTSYEVAVRIAPMQVVRLGNLRVEYDRNAQLELSGDREQPGAKITHELGFSILLNQLAGPVDPKRRAETLELLSGSVAETYKEMKVEQLEVDRPHQRKFEHSTGDGVRIRYRDAQGFGHTSLVYLVTGEGFAASCIVHYLDNDADNVLPLVKRTLDSIGIEAKR